MKIKIIEIENKNKIFKEIDIFMNYNQQKFNLSDKERNILEKFLDKNNKEIIENYEKFNSFIVYGDVQSGKTNNLIYLISNLFILNKLDIVIYLTGGENTILNQNHQRFLKIVETLNKNFLVMKNSRNLDINEVWNKTEKGKKIVINSLKNSINLERLFKLMESKLTKFRVLIIDDESDNYSLSSKSKNWRSNVFLKSNIKLLSISASPFSNLIDKSYKESLFKVYDNLENYYSLDLFLKKNKFISFTDNEDDINIAKKAFLTWIIISGENNLKNSQLLVNNLNINEKHEEIYRSLEAWFKRIKMNSSFLRQELKIFKDKKIDLKQISIFIKKISLSNFIIFNSKTKNDINHENINKGYKIIIGGIKLGRGITFENLIVQCMLNMGKKIDAGTLIQRARWLGYREKTFQFMKIFTNQKILNSFYEIKELIKITKRLDFQKENLFDKIQEKNFKYIKLERDKNEK